MRIYIAESKVSTRVGTIYPTRELAEKAVIDGHAERVIEDEVLDGSDDHAWLLEGWREMGVWP